VTAPGPVPLPRLDFEETHRFLSQPIERAAIHCFSSGKQSYLEAQRDLDPKLSAKLISSMWWLWQYQGGHQKVHFHHNVTSWTLLTVHSPTYHTRTHTHIHTNLRRFMKQIHSCFFLAVFHPFRNMNQRFLVDESVFPFPVFLRYTASQAYRIMKHDSVCFFFLKS